MKHQYKIFAYSDDSQSALSIDIAELNGSISTELCHDIQDEINGSISTELCHNIQTEIVSKHEEQKINDTMDSSAEGKQVILIVSYLIIMLISKSSHACMEF